MENETIRYKHLQENHNLKAPSEIVPYLIKLFNPKSVIDIGCGIGTFLKVFLDNGIENIQGLDGEWVDLNKLYIPAKYFRQVNLEEKILFEKKFELVLCLEVAEHLDELHANNLVNNLVRAGDIIIFSAAIKNQGGQNHVNEQTFSYWIEKFAKHNFIFVDIFRDHFWNNINMDWWYKQNMFLAIPHSFDISAISFDSANLINEYVHPELLKIYTEQNLLLKGRISKMISGKSEGRLYFSMLGKFIRRKLSKKINLFL